MEQEYPALNGITPSWADVLFKAKAYDGPSLDTADYAAFKWSETAEVGEKRQAGGGIVVATTTGSVKCEASVTFYREGWRRMKAMLKAIAPLRRGNQRAISLAGFDYMIQHSPPGESEIYVVKLMGCRVIGRSHDMQEGVDPDKIEVPLHVKSIVEVEPDGTEIVLL